MKILHVYKTYYPDSFGGIEQAIRHLANGCKVHGVSSEVLTCSPNAAPEKFAFEDHHVTQAQTNLEISSTPFSAAALGKYRGLAAESDLVNFHYPYPFGDAVSLLSGIRKPSVVTYHSDIVRQKFLKFPYAPMQHLFLRSVDRIICTSEQYLKSSPILQRYRYKTEPVSLGLDKNMFPKADANGLKKWSAQISQPFFLFLGVLRSYKGVDILIEAAKGLNGQLVIAGGGPEYDSLQKQAAKLKLTNIHFTGRINESDKAALLELCTALVLPSHLRSEAFGLVQLEAAMQRKPLICTEIGTGTSYVNEHENTGLVVPPKNPDALRNAMNFMTYHPQITEKMGIHAEERYRELFSAEKMCAEYARIYEEVLAEKPIEKAALAVAGAKLDAKEDTKLA